jgi:hypothetical protein
LEKTQPPPTMDGIVLVMVDEFMHTIKNEPMVSIIEDKVELSVGS